MAAGSFFDVRRDWQLLEHDADIGLSATAATREELFAAMAEALTAVVTSPGLVECRESIDIRCSAPDDDVLLVDWLNALIYEMATRHMLFCRWEVQLGDHTLHAKVCGEAIDRLRHQPAVEVKGATYTALSVARDDRGRWHANCVVDV